jgi:hypothetical protein
VKVRWCCSRPSRCTRCGPAPTGSSRALLEDCAAEPIGRDLARSDHESSVLVIETLFGWVSESAAFEAALRGTYYLRRRTVKKLEMLSGLRGVHLKLVDDSTIECVSHPQLSQHRLHYSSSPIGARKYEVVTHPRAFRRTGLRPKWTTRWSPMMTAVAVTSTIGV